MLFFVKVYVGWLKKSKFKNKQKYKKNAEAQKIPRMKITTFFTVLYSMVKNFARRVFTDGIVPLHLASHGLL